MGSLRLEVVGAISISMGKGYCMRKPRVWAAAAGSVQGFAGRPHGLLVMQKDTATGAELCMETSLSLIGVILGVAKTP